LSHKEINIRLPPTFGSREDSLYEGRWLTQEKVAYTGEIACMKEDCLHADIAYTREHCYHEGRWLERKGYLHKETLLGRGKMACTEWKMAFRDWKMVCTDWKMVCTDWKMVCTDWKMVYTDWEPGSHKDFTIHQPPTFGWRKHGVIC